MKNYAVLALVATLSLSACTERNDPPQPDPAKPIPETAIGRSIDKAMDKARAKLATENIDLADFHVDGNDRGVVIIDDGSKDDSRPKAELTPQGDLLIEGRKIEANPEQHALLVQYRKQVEGVAHAGMDIGVQGAELGVKAATEAIKGIFSGNTDDVEQRVEAEAEQIKLAARKLCDQLPAMLDTQTKLAAAMPEFKPYATMDQGDIDDCYKDDDLKAPQIRAQVQRETREEIRKGIRQSIQAVTQGTGVAAGDGDMDAAAEAEAASADESGKQ